MALVEANTSLAVPASALVPCANPVPFDALAQLKLLHDEAGRDLQTARFLARAPQACILLLAAGGAIVWACPRDLPTEFTWALMLLTGIVAIVRNTIAGFASGAPGLSVQAAALQLRGLLLYCGLAWGSGAFLMLPSRPSPILTFAFAIVPAAAMALILKDGKGTQAFALPVAVATVTAALLVGWPHGLAVSLAILAALPGAMAIPALQQKPGPLGRARPVRR